MKKNVFSCLIVLFFGMFIGINGFSQGYDIKLKFKNLKLCNVILGYHFNENLIPADTAIINDKGEGSFNGKDTLTGGMYFVYLPSKTYFDLMIGKDQQFTMESDTTNFLETVKFQGSEENMVFFEYQKFLQKKNSDAESMRKEKETFKDNPNKVKEIDAKLVGLNADVKKEIDRVIITYPKLFTSKFLKSTLEIDIPEGLSELDRYLYYRKHYFDHFDLSDGRLLRTPLYDRKLKTYLEKLLPQIPDTIKPELDRLASLSKHSKELYRYMMVTLHNFYRTSQIMGMDAVYVYFDEKYYLSSDNDWSDAKYLTKIRKEIPRVKNTLIGNTALDITMQKLPTDTIALKELINLWKQTKEKGNPFYKTYQDAMKPIRALSDKAKSKSDSAIVAQEMVNQLVPLVEDFNTHLDEYVALLQFPYEYTIVWFWDPNCSHCTEETPRLKEFYNRFKKYNIGIYSVLLQESLLNWEKFTNNLNDWIKFINQHKINDWTNAWDPYGHTLFREKYDISSSPVSFILDKDKKIVAKRLGVPQIEEIFHNILIDNIFKRNKDNIKANMKACKEYIDDNNFKESLEMLKDIAPRRFDEKERKELEEYIAKKLEKFPADKEKDKK